MKLIMSRVLLVLVAVAAMHGPVSAHAVLVSSTPKDRAVIKVAPKQVVLNFNSRTWLSASGGLFFITLFSEIQLTRWLSGGLPL